MRTSAVLVAVVALGIAFAPAGLRRVVADETVIVEEGAAAAPGSCGCRDPQAPPWHGTVAGDQCGPSCPPPNVFHANPCGQLWLKHHARLQGCTLPPCFPRMHARGTEGTWPTPRPVKLPRCPVCGTHIEQGM